MSYASVFRRDLFAGQVMLVTGGGSGIGRCIARELSSLGATVVISGRTKEKLEKTCEELSKAGGKPDFHVCDIREEDQVKGLFKDILAKHGKLSGLVNNAGGQFPSRLEALSKNAWEAVVRNNLTGTFLVSREALNQCFVPGKGGAIVNIMAEFRNGMPGMGHSGAARAGVDNMTKTASIEWAKYGVRVNGIAPGIVESSGLDTYDPKFMELTRKNAHKIPLKRFATESEISGAVAFLLSPAASYVTGVTLWIDGGLSLRGHTSPLEDYPASPAFEG
jgi:citronellol/citronellal dehydrogenase